MELVLEAKAAILATVSETVKPLLKKDDVLVIDMRGNNEFVDGGKVKGTLYLSRGMLEITWQRGFRRGQDGYFNSAPCGPSTLVEKVLIGLNHCEVPNLASFEG